MVTNTSSKYYMGLLLTVPYLKFWLCACIYSLSVIILKIFFFTFPWTACVWDKYEVQNNEQSCLRKIFLLGWLTKIQRMKREGDWNSVINHEPWRDRVIVFILQVEGAKCLRNELDSAHALDSVWILVWFWFFLCSHIFIWQTHNALFIICCLLKVFICEMSEEELQLHFTYEEKSPGSYSKYCLWRCSRDSVCDREG